MEHPGFLLGLVRLAVKRTVRFLLQLGGAIAKPAAGNPACELLHYAGVLYAKYSIAKRRTSTTCPPVPESQETGPFG
jgi:hypothetical protein